MSDSFINSLFHMVWSTKGHEPWIALDYEARLYSYFGGVLRKESASLLCGNGTADHVHLLVSMPASVSVATVVRQLKANSSRWLKEQPEVSRRFAWQTGYGAFSVSNSQKAKVIQYIERQKSHHERQSFHEEFLRLLRHHEIEFEERHVFD